MTWAKPIECLVSRHGDQVKASYLICINTVQLDCILGPTFPAYMSLGTHSPQSFWKPSLQLLSGLDDISLGNQLWQTGEQWGKALHNPGEAPHSAMTLMSYLHCSRPRLQGLSYFETMDANHSTLAHLLQGWGLGKVAQTSFCHSKCDHHLASQQQEASPGG